MKIKGKDLRVGDVIETWWKPGHDQIVEMRTYTGPFAFICGVARFAVNPTGMSIETESTYEVSSRHNGK